VASADVSVCACVGSGICLSRLSEIAEDSGSAVEALELSESAIKMLIGAVGVEWRDVSACMERAARLLHASTPPRLLEALRHVESAYTIRVEAAGRLNLSAAATADTAVAYLEQLGRPHDAFVWLKRALHIRESALGAFHDDSIATRERVESYRERGIGTDD
jgi:hypothetical protein